MGGLAAQWLTYFLPLGTIGQTLPFATCTHDSAKRPSSCAVEEGGPKGVDRLWNYLSTISPA